MQRPPYSTTIFQHHIPTIFALSGQTEFADTGQGQIGSFYHEHPVFIIAVTQKRYSWRFLQEVPEFVIAVPDDSLRSALHLCGTRSGCDIDKFNASGLTPVPSMHVQAPSIAECPIVLNLRILLLLVYTE